MNGFISSFQRTARLTARHPLDAAHAVAFFIIVTSLISVTVDNGTNSGNRDAFVIAIIWVVVLLATMLGCAAAYSQDYEDGSLELLVAHQRPLFPSVLGSMMGLWFFSTLPILLCVPLGAWMLTLSTSVWWMLLLTLLAGSIVFTLFGVLGAVLTLGIGRNGVLMALLVLPLYVPVLLLGVGACQRYANGETFEFALASLFAIAVALVTFVPFAIAALLRVSQEY